VTVDPVTRIVTAMLNMSAQGTLRGHVTFVDGRPAARVGVQAFKTVYWNGQLILGASSRTYTATSNAQGEFRFSLVDPGEYYVAAGSQDSSAKYEKSGSFVVVPRGKEVAVDVEARPQKTLVIAGSIVDAIPNNEPHTIYALYLVDRDVRVREDFPRDEIPTPSRILGTPTIETNADAHFTSSDRFEIHNVRPGEYDLFVMIIAGAKTYMGKTSIAVKDRNLSDVVLEVRAGVDIEVRMTEYVDLYLRAAGTTPTLPNYISTPHLPNTDGKRSWFSDVAPGTYRLQIGDKAGKYVADIRLNGESILASGLISMGTSPPGAVEIVIGDLAGTIRGVVRSATGLAGFATVGLVPQGEKQSNLVLYRGAVADSAGAFTIDGIAPGEYRLFALDRFLYRGALNNADFVSRYRSLGSPVTVKRGDKLQMDIDLITPR